MFRPHTVVVHPPVPGQDATNMVVGGNGYGAGVTKAVHVQPATVTQEYGTTGPDLDGRYLVVDYDVSGYADWPFGALVVWDGRTFKVVARPMKFACGLPTDHLEIEILEQKDKEQSPEPEEEDDEVEDDA